MKRLALDLIEKFARTELDEVSQTTLKSSTSKS